MKILWLKTELLHPVDKGGKIRTYHMLKELKRHHHITYLTLDDGTADPDALEKAEEYAHEVITVPHRVAPKFGVRFYAELVANLFSPLPYFISKYRAQAMTRKISEVLKEDRHDILICDFLQSSINLPEEISIPSLLFQHNVEAMIWKRHADVATNPIKKAYLESQWKRAVDFERNTCRRFDSVIAVSAEDAAVFRSEYGLQCVFDVPTGVDTAFFARRNDDTASGPNLVFTGSMDWLPNHDAINWFINDILPTIRHEVPDVSLTVVGRDPFPELRELARRYPNITVTGRVPDVRPLMKNAAVYVVPIRIGGGTRLKIYEAMAMGLPVVSTTIGAEGLPLTDGNELLLKDTVNDFANSVIRLLKNDREAVALGIRAAKRVRSEFGWQHAADQFASICEQAVEA